MSPPADVGTRRVLRLAAPMALSSLAWAALSLTNAAFLGHTSAQALAGVALATFALEIAIGFSMGFCQAIATTVAMSSRSSEHELVGRSVGAALALIPALSVIAAGVGVVVTLLLPQVSDDPGTVAAAERYLWIRLIAVPMVLYMAILRGTRYGLADTAWPTAVMFGATVLNIPVDYVLISRLGYGVDGAAWGTNGVLLVAALVLTARELRRTGVRPRRPTRAAVRHLTKLGVPIGFKDLSGKVGWVVVAGVVASLGQDPLGAHFVASHICFTILVPAYAARSATQVLAAQLVASNHFTEVVPLARRAALASVACTGALGLPLLLAPADVASLFGADGSAVPGAISTVLTLGLVAALLEACYRPLEGALAGVGDAVAPSTFTLIMNTAYTPAIAVLGTLHDEPLVGVWMALGSIHALAFGFMCYRVVSGRWLRAARRALRDMRRAPRLVAMLAAERVSPAPGRLTVVDLSASGAFLQGAADDPPWQVGQHLTIRLVRWDEVGALRAEVVRLAGEGERGVGVRFLDEDAAARLQPVLLALAEHVARRRVSRDSRAPV